MGFTSGDCKDGLDWLISHPDDSTPGAALLPPDFKSKGLGHSKQPTSRHDLPAETAAVCAEISLSAKPRDMNVENAGAEKSS
ncbi:hypothetical protein AMECASPLE_005074 [Ameca splendens]|uniref:Uncharacterized protein n=1 Tax=Ameca splendens TaxID=208324 RepID=A0ABV0ZXT8_9TELE